MFIKKSQHGNHAVIFILDVNLVIGDNVFKQLLQLNYSAVEL